MVSRNFWILEKKLQKTWKIQVAVSRNLQAKSLVICCLWRFLQVQPVFLRWQKTQVSKPWQSTKLRRVPLRFFIAQYDLTDPEALQSLIDLLHVEKDRIVAVHLAPACGTASRAREKKLTSLAKQGYKIPGPLRSQTKPMGLDGLEGLDKVRTETANIVYAATAKLVKVCISLGILCSVENPENSLFLVFS